MLQLGQVPSEAPETKPVPLTVNVKSGPPGATAEGTSGWLTNGTGLLWPRAGIAVNDSERQRSAAKDRKRDSATCQSRKASPVVTQL